MALTNSLLLTDDSDMAYAEGWNQVYHSRHGNYIISGCGVTEQGVPDLTVAVASGSVFTAGDIKTVSSGNPDLTDAYNDLTTGQSRFVYIYIKNDGSISNPSDAGGNEGVGSIATSGQQYPPLFSSLAEDVVILARILLTFGDTAINTSEIKDMRQYAPEGGYYTGSLIIKNSATDNDKIRLTTDTLTGYFDKDAGLSSFAWRSYGTDNFGGSPTTLMTIGTSGQLALPVTGSSAGLLIGGDVQLYRSAANELGTPDSLNLTSTSSRIAVGTSILSRIGLRFVPTFTDSATAVYGQDMYSTLSGASPTDYFGVRTGGQFDGTTLTNLYGMYIRNFVGSGAVTNQYGLYIEGMTKGGTINYGLYIGTPSGATTNRSVYLAGGEFYNAGTVGRLGLSKNVQMYGAERIESNWSWSSSDSYLTNTNTATGLTNNSAFIYIDLPETAYELILTGVSHASSGTADVSYAITVEEHNDFTGWSSIGSGSLALQTVSSLQIEDDTITITPTVGAGRRYRVKIVKDVISYSTGTLTQSILAIAINY